MPRFLSISLTSLQGPGGQFSCRQGVRLRCRLTNAFNVPRELQETNLYSRMIDCEIVLRFFAFREKQHIAGSVRTILDRCMERHQSDDSRTIAAQRASFLGALSLAKTLFGPRMFDITEPGGDAKPSQPFFDALMVALDELRPKSKILIKKKAQVADKVRNRLRQPRFYDAIVAKANTAAGVRDRQKRLLSLLREFTK
jgi:hypothetical protein